MDFFSRSLHDEMVGVTKIYLVKTLRLTHFYGSYYFIPTSEWDRILPVTSFYCFLERATGEWSSGQQVNCVTKQVFFVAHWEVRQTGCHLQLPPELCLQFRYWVQPFSDCSSHIWREILASIKSVGLFHVPFSGARLCCKYMCLSCLALQGRLWDACCIAHVHQFPPLQQCRLDEGQVLTLLSAVLSASR